LHVSKKNYDIALRYLNSVIKQDSSRRIKADAYRLFGIVYEERGFFEKAVTSYKESLKLSYDILSDRRTKDTMYSLGVILFEQDKYEEALEIFNKLRGVEYNYKDIDRIIKSVNGKMLDKEDAENYTGNHIMENPSYTILKKGLLFSNNTFDIESLEAQVEKNLGLMKLKKKKGKEKTHVISSYVTIDELNEMESKEFKEIARKIVQANGFNIKSEPKFSGDDDYIDGNAINFLAAPTARSKTDVKVLITIRRYSYPVEEVSISRFLEWFEDYKVDSAIYIVSNEFTSDALDVLKTKPEIKNINKGGLLKLLTKVKL